MRYLTDRKRATGLGSARSGTAHHWHMTVTSVALALLVPLFLYAVAPMIGRPYTEVNAWFSRPFPALVTSLTLLVGMIHFRNGAQIMIEDYLHGAAGRYAIIAVTCVAYALAAAGLFAIGRIAL